MNYDWELLFELFGFSMTAAVLAGLVCPLVGCFLLLRRTSFLGIALPQFAATGVACGFLVLPWWVERVGIGDLEVAQAMADTHATMSYHLGWALVFTFGGLGMLLALGRRGGSETARVAAAFAMASAATILFTHASPVGDVYVHQLLSGEILAIGVHELETLAAVLGGTALLFLWFRKDLLLVSFDRETARALGKHVVLHEALLHVLTGFTVSAGVLTLGPVVLFGLLVLPPVAGRSLARSMRSLYIASSLSGLISAVGGLWVSFRFDLPLGPAIVGVASLLCALAFLLGLRPGARA